MTTITWTDTDMIINIEGLDKLLAFKGKVTIPLAHIVKVEHNTKPLMDFKHATFGIGTIFAGRIQAGSFKEDGEKSFWDVRDPKKAILITLKDEEYGKLLVEVDNTDEVMKALEASINPS
jgi:hypothetical protein